jgi:hypothetical protein
MFLNIWLAFTLSEFGSSVASVVLPLVAATLLHAVPLQMSVIASANTLPFLGMGVAPAQWRRGEHSPD